MRLKETISGLDNVQNIKVVLLDRGEVISIKEDGVYVLDKDKLLDKKVHVVKRTGNETATIEMYFWR